MDPNEKIEWSALEYEEKERNPDWFWALGIIVIAGSITSIIFKNYFFALLLIIGGFLIGFFAIKKPENVNYELNKKGLKIKNRLYPYDDINTFWVQEEFFDENGREFKPTLFIKTKRLIMPMISIPIDNFMGDKIKEIMLSNNILEEEMREHTSEHIMDSLGF